MALRIGLVTALAAARLVAQQPAVQLQVTLGFGVDTARAPNREILAVFQHYLTHRLDTIRPNPDWSPNEQQRWPVFDLAGGYVYQGFSNFTVVQLAPAVGLDSTYLIRVLVSAVDSTQAVRPLALYRIYAVREAGRWVLANALPRMTRKWPHETIGSVTFHYPPTHAFARARAAETSQFADSLARAFEVPIPDIEYYFTDDLIETLRAVGLEYFPIGEDTVGGRANVADRQVFVGSSAAGETYHHEVAHIVLRPLVERSHPPGVLMEGLMTWTGGSAGLGFRALLPGLVSYLDRHPEITLDTVLRHPPSRDGTLDVGYDGAAALCALVFERAGRHGVETLLSAGSGVEQVLAAAARIIGVSRVNLDLRWRQWLESRPRARAHPSATVQPASQSARPWSDSTAHGPRAEIYRTWLRYLGSIAGHFGTGAWQPSPYWLRSEQRRWHAYALAMAYMPDSATPEVLSIDPVSKDEYRVVTRFTEDSVTSPMRAPVVRMTVFAVREQGHWVFANALPRLTRSWRREAVQGLTYVMEPGYPFDRTRAERAAAFVDSLATAFGVPRLTSFTYYLTTSSDEIYRIMGLETDSKWGPVGGVSQPTNHQLFSGNPAVGEDYRHELAHMVLLPLMRNTLYFVSEGVPTWVGGTSGMDFKAAARQFAGFLSEHPGVTLDSILDGGFPPTQFYPAAAVFADMANDEGGVAAVKALYDSGDDFRKSMERLFKKPWAQIAVDWRRKALSFGS